MERTQRRFNVETTLSWRQGRCVRFAIDIINAIDEITSRGKLAAAEEKNTTRRKS